MNGELEALLERLAERVAERVCDRLVAHEAVANEQRSSWMGIDKAASYLDWPRQRLYNLTAAGEIPHYKQDGRLLFRSDELDRWLAQFAQGQRPPDDELCSGNKGIVAFDGNNRDERA